MSDKNKQMKDKIYKTPEDKVEDLKKAIQDLGFKVEDAGEGEIKIEYEK